MAGAFMGCVVNLGTESTPARTLPRRDVKESVFSMSCLTPFGNYSGTSVILWELGIIIDLEPGDLLFFPDSLIHHSNEPVSDVRHSIVAFTQQNMFDFAKRRYRIVDKRANPLKERKKRNKNSVLRLTRIKKIKK